MTYKFEKVFSDTGSELSTATLSTVLGQGVQSCYDGRFMWVTAANGVAIYEFWGESSGDEPTVDEVDDLTWARYTEEGPLRKLKLITFIKLTGSQMKRSTRYKQLSLVPDWAGGAGSTSVGSVAVTITENRSDLLVYTEVSSNSNSLTPYFMCKVGSKMVVSNGAAFTSCHVFDIATQRWDRVISFGNEDATTLDSSTPVRTGNSNLVGVDGKIFFTNLRFDDVRPQRLISYRLSDDVMDEADIDIRQSTTRTWITNGFNGYLYITNFNGVSVAKWDYATMTQASRIRTNGLPTRIFSDQNRRIFVGSFAGMLTLVDWDDDGVHNSYSYGDGTLYGFAPDTNDSTKVWFTDGEIFARYDLNTLEQLETGSDDDDWIITDSEISSPDWIEIVPEATYTTSAGASRTQRSYMFIIDGSTVRLFALDNYLIRDNFFEVNGNAAAVGGTLEYFGETN